MLQDQRVISTSAVRCVGNTLILQGRVYSPPYVITAIGDRDAMRAALDTDPAVANLRDWSIAVGLGYDVGNVGPQTFPAYSGSIVPRARRGPRLVSVRRVVGWSGELLVTLGVLLLLFAAWQLWWTDVVADRAQAADRADPRGRLRPRHPGAGAATTASRRRSVRTAPSRSCASRGSAATTCARSSRAPAAPCWPWASATTSAPRGPGQVGNFAVAGHRTTYGRPFHDVDQLVDGDRVVVETAAAGLRLRGRPSREIVRPGDVEVIAPVPGDPGTAPDRGADHDDLVPPEVQRHRSGSSCTAGSWRRCRARSGSRPAGSPPRRRADRVRRVVAPPARPAAGRRAVQCLVLALSWSPSASPGCSRR